MTLEIERIPALGDNYNYLLVCTTTGEAAVVDPAEAEPIVRCVEEREVRLTQILNTHHHYDHCGGNVALAERYGIPIYAHESDADRVPGFSHGLADGDRIEVGEQSARVIFVPAHTLGHIAYYFEEADALFCGDTLFAGGCGRLFEGDAAMMYAALCEKFAALPEATRVYCGHEYTVSNLEFASRVDPDNEALRERLEAAKKQRARAAADWHDARPDEMTIPSSIGEEKRTNPFMRADSAEELGRIRQLKDAS